jgi:very-short-patch-repair endonuclease
LGSRRAPSTAASGRRGCVGCTRASTRWGDIHLTSQRSTAAPIGIVSHRVRALPEDQTRKGLPVTTVARTLLDLADTEPPHTIRRLLGDALYQKRTSVPQLTKELQTSPGRRSHAVLKRLIETASATHSDVERAFLDLVKKAGLPKPETNFSVAGYKVDACWPRWRLVVELDTFHSHGDHLSFEDDRRRDAALARAGWRVLRFSDDRLRDEPLKVVGAIYSAASSHQ